MNVNRFKNLLGLCTTILLLAKPSLQKCEIQEIVRQIHGSPFSEPPNFSSFPGYPHPYSPMATSKFAKCENERSIDDAVREIARETPIEELEYLEITKSELGTLDDGFLNSSKMLEMRLSDCDIDDIEIDAFENLGSLQRLELNHNKIWDIEDGPFSHLRNLSILDLSFNHIELTHENSFQGLTNLKQLNLQNNMLRKLEDNIFHDLTNLEILNLAFNRLKVLDKNTFEKLPNLISVHLNNNELTELHPDLFSENTKLKELYIDNNALSRLDTLNLPATCITVNATRNLLDVVHLDKFSKVEILDLSESGVYKISTSVDMSTRELYLNDNFLGHEGMERNQFDNFRRLEALFLDDNQLKKIEKGIFIDQISLKTLGLSGASMQEFDAMEVPGSIQKLNLTMNSLQKLEHLNRLKNLTKLQLGFNNLTHISANFFEGLTELSELLLNNNHLTTLELGCFRDLKSLYFLDLSYNDIATLELGVFGGLPELQTLNLAHNQLKTLESGVFHSVKNLLRLDLSYNQLNYLDVEATLSHIVWMEELSLEGNNWSCSFIADIIRENKMINIKEGNESSVTNVRGIACTNNKDGASGSNQNISAKQYAEGLEMLSGKLTTNNVVIILILLLLIVKFMVKYDWRHLKNCFLFLRRRTQDKDIQLIS